MPAPHTLDELIHRIKSCYEDLSPQFQAGARYLIDHPIQVSTLSARKLAVLAQVQPATLVRLAQHLGYDGWDAMKSVFTRDFQLPPGSYAARAQSLVQRPETIQAVWETAIAQHSRNLNALSLANQKTMTQVVEQLRKAKRILVAGFRSCYPAAFNLRYLCNLFRSDVHLLHNTGGTMDMDLHHLHSDDTVVLISYDPYSREISVVANAAYEAGCHIITLCDSQLAPIALKADDVMTFPTQGNSFIPSTVALHALVEMLAQQLLVRGGEEAIGQLARTETRLRASKAYL
ncbi:MurR/RpiR family transcriptional regulator [Candidimonas nitroreducens]|uniref:DNA-binding protein n=1 Tax=Candidimonas nitroreducens TaxID=683354 RepID=A0A225M6B3_9BURK|nr:MurR/RpiR family transcriptional regulator [Candidimonas nitroreducens]OWT56885.1 DNA-binding protein [Candidimonas nitroreducens]